MNQMMTVNQMAERLNVSKATIYSIVDCGDIECFRIRAARGRRGTIRFSEEQIQTYLEGVKTGAAKPKSPPPRAKLKHLSL